MSATLPEPWLRGPLPGIPPLLQPPAHALVMALEDTLSASAGLTDDQLWAQPGGAGSVGFHLAHLAGVSGGPHSACFVRLVTAAPLEL